MPQHPLSQGRQTFTASPSRGLGGELTVPGLDEYVAWKVSNGAGLLAEETRVSIFEVPD